MSKLTEYPFSNNLLRESVDVLLEYISTILTWLNTVVFITVVLKKSMRQLFKLDLMLFKSLFSNFKLCQYFMAVMLNENGLKICLCAIPLTTLLID